MISSSNHALKVQMKDLRFLTTDDRASIEKLNDEGTKIDDSKKSEDMKVADEQVGIEEPEKVQAKSINYNPDVSLTDVLKEPVKAEVQSLVDVLVHQENPAIQRTSLFDPVVTMIQEKTTH
ncbi:hypothetical protein Tco_0621021 [Tanacetum coccineum]